jgi:hypothetical protein
MPDPTNARLRDFDIPVVMPRFDFITLPAAPATTASCATPPATALTLAASAGVPAPVVKLGLPASGKRKSAYLREHGLPFSVAADKPIADVEVRLVELLDGGRLRPLGVKVVLEPVKGAVHAVVLPTPFAAKTLTARGRRSVRAIAIVTAWDGSAGQTHADFTLS